MPINYVTRPGSSATGGAQQKLDFIIGITNMTWPGIAAVQSGFANLTAAGMRTTGTLNSAMSTTQAAMMALGGASALAISLMTVEAAKFQREMAMVKSLVGNMTDNELARLSAQAKKLAVDFGEAPIEVAKGLQMIARAGVNEASDQLEVLTQSMRLAKIEGLDIADVAKTLITTSNLFGDSYQNVERYASLMAQVSNVSVVTVKDMANALKYFGGAAREHWTPEETLAAITTLGQQGIEGSLAGTSLRSFTTYLTREMPKSQKALKQLGLTFDDFWEKSGGKRTTLKPIQEIITTMHNAAQMQGMGRGDLFKILSQFGEPRMAQQYIKLFPTEEELDSGTWALDKFNKEMQEHFDMSERLNTVMATAQERWNQFIASVRVLAVNVGESVLPPLTLLLNMLKMITIFVAENKVLTTALAYGLLALGAAGAAVVAKWGWGIIAKTWAEGTEILSGGLKQLVSIISAESAAVDKNTASYIANAAARNVVGGGGIYPVRNTENWAVTRAEKMSSNLKAGAMTGGGFYGATQNVEDAFLASYLVGDIVEARKGGGIRGINAPLEASKWEAWAKRHSGIPGDVEKHGMRLSKDTPIIKDGRYSTFLWGKNEVTEKAFTPLERQGYLRDMLASQYTGEMRSVLTDRNALAELRLGAGNTDQIKIAMAELEKKEAMAYTTAALLSDYDFLTGVEKPQKQLGLWAATKQKLGAWGTKAKDFAYSKGTIGDTKFSKLFEKEIDQTTLKFAKAGERAPAGAYKTAEWANQFGRGARRIPVGGQFLAEGTMFATTAPQIVNMLPGFLTALPLLGTALAGAGIGIVALAVFFDHLGKQIEENIKRVKQFEQETSKLEKTAKELEGQIDKSKPGEPGYFERREELKKTNEELDGMYRKIATANREIYNAKAWQPWEWPEWREDKGPSWYTSFGGSIVGSLTPEKWTSGENLSKLLGFEPSYAGGAFGPANWMSGPQEQMLSEAYKVEKRRQTAIANLNNAHNAQMQAIEERHKQGRFRSEDEYLKTRNTEIDKYNKKRIGLDKEHDKETAKIVGPQNVDATRRLYQMEERLKTARLSMLNAIMKILDVTVKLIMLPLTILGIFNGDALKASQDGMGDRTENLSDKINAMANQMEAAAERMENFAKSVAAITDPIFYAIYAMTHFVAWIKGMAQWLINPLNWFTKEVPGFSPESFEDWKKTNAEGKEHYDPSKLKDNALARTAKWITSEEAGKDIEAQVKNIPHAIQGWFAGGKNEIEKFGKSITGAPSTIWNAIFGPKERKTPEELRREAEAKAQGKKPGELYEVEANKESAEEKKKKQEGLEYGLHSPFTIHAGTSGNIGGGIKSLVFPDLDPNKTKDSAVLTAKEILSEKTMGGFGKQPVVSPIQFPDFTNLENLMKQALSQKEENSKTSINIEKFVIERVSDDEEEMKRVVKVGLKEIAKELGLE